MLSQHIAAQGQVALSEKGVDLQDGDRQMTEGFIQEVFRKRYGANVNEFLPTLVCLKNAAQEPVAALGFQGAGKHALFLECYLQEPVESLLAAHTGSAVDRGRIVEVGNLALGRPGSAREIIALVTGMLHAVDVEWVVFTTGPLLANSFRRLGLPLLDLGPAEITALPPKQRAKWGSYYEQGPRVMAGCLADAHSLLRTLGRDTLLMTRLKQEAQLLLRSAA